MTKFNNWDWLKSFAHRSVFSVNDNGCQIDCRGITSEDSMLILRICAAALVFALALILPVPKWLSILLLVLVAIAVGFDILLTAVSSVLGRKLLEPCVWVTFVALFAFVIGQPKEAAAVFLLFQILEFAMRILLHGVNRVICKSSLPTIPAKTIVASGKQQYAVSVDEVMPGDSLVLESGAMACVDCVITDGGGAVDLSAVTGDNTPVTVRENDTVISGAVNIGTSLECQATERAADSAAQRIAAVLQSAGTAFRLNNRLCGWALKLFPNLVLVAAVLTTVGLAVFTELGIGDCLHRALAVLILGLPCSLMISIPVAYYACCGVSVRSGVLIRNPETAEVLSRANTVVFDKAGTLSAGEPRVTAVKSEKMSAEMMLKIASHAEAYSSHPLAKAIISAYGGVIYIELVQKYKEFEGEGIAALISDVPVLLGSQSFLTRNGISVKEDDDTEQVVYMAIGNAYAGRFLFGSTTKATAADAISDLRMMGISRIAVTTSNRVDTARNFADILDSREIQVTHDADDCAKFVKTLTAVKNRKDSVIFAGGSPTVASAMDYADAAAMVGPVTDCLNCTAAGILVFEEPVRLADALANARFTDGVASLNRMVSLAAKVILIVLGILGIIPIWLAMTADAVVSAITVFMALRALRSSQKNTAAD